MRIAVAQVIQETCSFSPLATTIERFRDTGLREGDDVIDGVGASSALAGFLDLLRDRGGPYEIVPLVDAAAVAGGPLTSSAHSFLSQRLRAQLQAAGRIDACYLSLHGASAAETEPDIEGHLLDIVRSIVGRSVPIVVSLDHHGNVTARMVGQLDGLVAHRSQPHDPPETGALAAEQLISILEGRIDPTIAWRKIPLLTHQEQFATDRGPMRRWFEAAREHEALPNIVSVSAFPLQPWLDVPEAGWSTVVVSDGDAAAANAVADRHARLAWSLRERFREMVSVPVADAVRDAAAATDGVVLLSDVGDSVLGGAPGDSSHILAELLRQQVTGPVFVPVVDVPAVRAAVHAGPGATITVDVGGTLAPGFHRAVRVTGVVAGIECGEIEMEAAGFSAFDMGQTVLLDCGSVQLVISEQEGVGGIHPVIYRRLSLHPEEAQAIVVKTAANFQHYRSLASKVIRVDSPGPTTSHLEQLPWRRVPRPIYPLDTNVHF